MRDISRDLPALPAWDPETECLNVITETPKNSRNKIKWSPRHGLFLLDKVLPEGHVFPFDFGFVPGTQGPDGDPIDVLLLIEEAIGFSGCIVMARPVGVIEAEQTAKGKTIRNDRILAAATASRFFAKTRTLNDLPESLLTEVEHFFVSYNEMEDRKFKPIGRGGPEKATELVTSSLVSA